MNILSKIHKLRQNKDKQEILSIMDWKLGLGRLERFLSSNWFNPFLTIWINLRSFPLRQAWKLPLWTYGRPKIHALSGSMLIKGKVSCGMIKFNKIRPGTPSYMSLHSEIYNLGKIIFHGSGYIGTGNKIFVNHGAILSIGDNFAITDMVNLGCMKHIEIKAGISITHRCQILDSNYHYLANFTTKTIRPRTKPIIIGKRCWIGNSSTITGGTHLPDYTIVCSYSLVNSSTNNISSNSMIGGIPAKLLSTGYRRVYNNQYNKALNKHYDNIDAPVFKFGNEWNMEDCSIL